ncbi:transcriptional regulator family: C2H2 zinc finger [Penicillium psychrosexuale]|uniref:transcriptional regulator family: C2H2 zinc finger n=1 Tax=Penicillium psychrosexuale TaxID=1002107 RepID=UPI002545AA42|nr:transcriptional regulator family: C2H2 zinc finger [Penicillium psychrosexuale]KAJ5800503.1 transcriptional regulator family: C2H2 zinc finger [Penicillium psychrosexuale]
MNRNLVQRTSITSPRREEIQSCEASSIYSSPVSTSSQGGVSPIGLGISRCDIDNGFGQLRAFPTSTLPSQLIPGAPNPTFALSYDDYAGACYPSVYDGLVNSASETSLGFYSPTTMSASPSYNSGMEIASGQNVFAGQMTDMWMHTPCSGPTTPSDVVTVPNGAGQWGQSVYSDVCMPSAMPLLSVNDMSYLGAMGEEMGYDGSGINTGQVLQPQASIEGFSDGAMEPSAIERCSSNDRLVSASGLECPICGAKFTRRSNCKEHQKLHNPEWRHNHPCDECHKSFGRSSDLKRHMNTVHLGLRKYCCDSCDRRFSRQDSLARHDCAEKQRNAAKFTGHVDPSLTPKQRQRVPNHRRSAS